jgi:hypothetical protein
MCVATMTTTLQIAGLSKRSMAKLKSSAKSLGLTPEDYVKEVIEDRLELEEATRNTTFDQILAPLYKRSDEIGEDELNRMVDRAKARHRSRVTRKKR